jgi:hypothetical protein
MTIDRSQVFKDAHSRFRRRRGSIEPLTFAECLRRAWAAARFRRDDMLAKSPPGRKRMDIPFPKQPEHYGAYQCLN